MTCTGSSSYFQWAEQFPISFTEWKSLLGRLSSAQTAADRISSSSDHHQHQNHARSTSRHYQNSTTTQKQSRHVPKNQIFGNGSLVDSFVASSSNMIQSPFSSRQDVPKATSPPTKRYVSSFKTIVNATNSKHTQRLNYINDSVIILKLSKEKEGRNDPTDGQIESFSPSSKISSLSMASTTTATIQANTSNQQSLPPTLSPILKVEGHKRRTPHHDPPLAAAPAPPTSLDMAVASSSTTSMTTTGAPSHPQTNSSLFTYRSGAIGGAPTLRQRQIAEPTSNSLLITAERLKSNMTSSMRPARQPTTSMPSSAFFPAQQRNASQISRARIHQDKIANSREIYEYPDPFTNCPQDIMNKLAQLTKLQLETIEWEKKRRFTKKKTVTNGAIQGKDSP